jgi:hypothetical protein
MDGMTLLEEARAAGLTVLAEGGRLVVRGPKRAADLARRLLANKDQIMASLDRPDRPDRPAWDEAEANRMLASITPFWNTPGRPVALNPLGGEVDAALDARDLPRLRLAVAAFLAAVESTTAAKAGVPGPAVTDATPTEAELALVAGDLEQAMGQPAGSLVLVGVHRCNGYCCCHLSRRAGPAG